MKRVVFFTYNETAFGSIHYELCKQLFCKNIDAVLLPWNFAYTPKEIQELDAVTELFVTNPHGYDALVYIFGLQPEKIVVVAHAILDLHQMVEKRGIGEFNKPKDYAVVSSFLKDQSRKLGIKRDPIILPVGININRYSNTAAAELKTVGYAGTFSRVEKHTSYDIKRGYLVERCVQQAGLNLLIAEDYHNSFVTMAGFYSAVDCVIIASTEEGACLPMIEASAAGRLVITTPVGHWKEYGGENTFLTVPIEENLFIAKVTELLNYYKHHSAEFQAKCIASKKQAKAYDWSSQIDSWVKALS